MTDTLGAIKTVFAFLGPITTGAGFWAYLTERQKTRKSALSIVAESQASIANAVAGQVTLILAEHAKDRTDLRRIVAKQGRQLARLARDVADCNKHHKACEDNLAYVRAQIAQMIGAGQPATSDFINPHTLKDHLTLHSPEEQLDAPD